MPTDHTYKRNFINPAIFRLDFPIPVASLQSGERPALFQKKILKRFPVAEDSPQAMQGFEIGPEGAKLAERKTWTRYLFFDSDKTTSVGVEPSFIFVEQKSYQGSKKFKALAEFVVNCLFETWPDILVNRLGLRYVNDIRLDDNDGDVLDWTSYINENLIAPLKLVQRDQLARLILTTELRCDDYRVRVVSGVPNPDYPGLVKRKHFVIDIDVYTTQEVLPADVMKMFGVFQNVTIDWFESSITDTFRQYLDRE